MAPCCSMSQHKVSFESFNLFSDDKISFILRAIVITRKGFEIENRVVPTSNNASIYKLYHQINSL